jgi:serine/threonine-protein phosphatase PP1 catalytic subunit
MKNWGEKDSNDDSIDSDFEIEKPTFDVDKIIAQLLSPKVRNAGILSDLKESTINELVDKARDIFTS